MPLGKRELQKLINQKKEELKSYGRDIELLKDKEKWFEKHKDFYGLQDLSDEKIEEWHKLDSCSLGTGKYRTECELNLLIELLTSYYQPKKRGPTKLEFMEACLEYVEKRIPQFKSEKRHRYKTTWKYFLVNELKEKIEKLRNIKKIRIELKEVS